MISLLPEELLERILSLSIARSHSQQRPSWHTPNSFAPLLVSKLWLRIATPLFYQSIHISSPTQATALALVLSQRPPSLHDDPASELSLGSFVRHLTLDGCWPEVRHVLSLCPRLRTLDITIDDCEKSLGGDATHDHHHLDAGVDSRNDPRPAHDAGLVDIFGDSLRALDIHQLVVRKAASAYLTSTKARSVLTQLADAIPYWNNLHTADLLLKLSSTPSAAALATALSGAPCLRTLRAQIPAVWSPLLLCASENPALERIVLNPGQGVLGTGLFLMEVWRGGADAEERAKKERLGELIKRGTSFIRSRAHTMGTITPAVSTAALAACEVRAPEPVPPVASLSPSPLRPRSRTQASRV